MARRTTELTPQQIGCSGENRGQGIPLESVVASGCISPNLPPGLGCPMNKCNGRLTIHAAGYDSRTGLEAMECPLCGHRGFRSREGVSLLFRGGYEFKFSYGPSIQIITIVLSSAAVNLWGTHDVTDDQLAKIAAEWALLCGHKDGQVHLGIPSEQFADFYLYFCKQ